MSIDIELLKTFIEVNRTRHFGKASENLFVTQSTVSARIKLLEDAVGTPLFTRSRNNIQLTSSGERLLHYAESIITIWNQARQHIAIDDENTLLFNVAGMPSLWDITLQDWLLDVCREHPELVMNTDVTTFETISRRLLDGTLDLGFTFEPVTSDGIECMEIMRIPLILVSTRKGLDVETATSEEYLLVDWGRGFANTHARLHGDIPTPVLRTNLGRVALSYMLANGGTAYLAEPMVSEHLKKKKLFRVEGSTSIDRAAYACYPNGMEKMDLAMRLLAGFNIQAKSA